MITVLAYCNTVPLLSIPVCAMPPNISIITPALLSTLRGLPHLPRHSWYFVTGVTLSVLNLPHEIPGVFKYAIEKGPGSSDTKLGHEEQLEIARKMREALLKAAPIGGLPKVVHCPTHIIARAESRRPPGHQCFVCAQVGNSTVTS